MNDKRLESLKKNLALVQQSRDSVIAQGPNYVTMETWVKLTTTLFEDIVGALDPTDRSLLTQ